MAAQHSEAMALGIPVQRLKYEKSMAGAPSGGGEDEEEEGGGADAVLEEVEEELAAAGADGRSQPAGTQRSEEEEEQEEQEVEAGSSRQEPPGGDEEGAEGEEEEEEAGRTSAPSPYQLAVEDCADLACLSKAGRLGMHPGQFRFPSFFIVGWQARREPAAAGRRRAAGAHRGAGSPSLPPVHAPGCAVCCAVCYPGPLGPPTAALCTHACRGAQPRKPTPAPARHAPTLIPARLPAEVRHHLAVLAPQEPSAGSGSRQQGESAVWCGWWRGGEGSGAPAGCPTPPDWARTRCPPAGDPLPIPRLPSGLHGACPCLPACL